MFYVFACSDEPKTYKRLATYLIKAACPCIVLAGASGPRGSANRPGCGGNVTCGATGLRHGGGGGVGGLRRATAAPAAGGGPGGTAASAAGGAGDVRVDP